MYCPNCGKPIDLGTVEGEDFYSCKYCLKEYGIEEIEEEDEDE